MQSSPTSFVAIATTTVDRFDEFIQWARPFGAAGINRVHSVDYIPGAPYFEWSRSFLAHGDQSTKSWFLRYEYLDKGRSVFSRNRIGTPSVILLPDGLIAEGRFLEFAKAYLNISAYYRNVRSPLRSLVKAFSFLEHALRTLHNDSNDPSKFSAKVFDKAETLLQNSAYGPGKQYDIAKEMEILSGMIQGGHHSKTFRFATKGFRLLERPFVFTSSVPQAPRQRVAVLNNPDLNSTSIRITSEDVAAVGLSYRKSVSQYGPMDTRTFMAATAGLALTTVSMRVSDLLTLGRDAIYLVDDDSGRRRIRLARPKIGLSQDLPLSKKLGGLAEELFSCMLLYSAGAHEALRFYCEQYSDNFDAITEVYIPENLRPLFAKPFLSVEEVWTALGIRLSTTPDQLPQRLQTLNTLYFIERPNDIWGSATLRTRGSVKFVKLGDVEAKCAAVGLLAQFPSSISRDVFIDAPTAKKFVKGRSLRQVEKLLRPLFENGTPVKKHVRTADLKNWLLNDFKVRSRYPHWPYSSKERMTRLDEALLVWHHTDYDASSAGVEGATRLWWQPIPVTDGSINQWISKSVRGGPPYLFRPLDVKVSSGLYPSITLHQTRKFHHTQALLAGAHETFIDELAGRRSGRQSDHYDKRTPREILLRSIETFDPDEDFPVTGPVADQAKKIKITDRATFLYQNAAPKHITEIGGCSTDWSLEPCKQYGDCMRCDQHLWRKGDEKRLPHILTRRSYAMKMIGVAEEKIAKYDQAPHSLLLQLQQFKDDLTRCESILAVEANDSISVGTIVTFSAPLGVVTASGLTAQLANQEREPRG